MKLSELKAGQGKVDVEVLVKSKAEPRVMNKYGKELKVANAVAWGSVLTSDQLPLTGQRRL